MIIIKCPPNPPSASPQYFGEEQCFESSNNEEEPIRNIFFVFIGKRIKDHCGIWIILLSFSKVKISFNPLMPGGNKKVTHTCFFKFFIKQSLSDYCDSLFDLPEMSILLGISLENLARNHILSLCFYNFICKFTFSFLHLISYMVYFFTNSKLWICGKHSIPTILIQ